MVSQEIGDPRDGICVVRFGGDRHQYGLGQSRLGGWYYESLSGPQGYLNPVPISDPTSMASVPGGITLRLETSDLPRRRPLGKRLSPWQKKSAFITFDAKFTISAGTSSGGESGGTTASNKEASSSKKTIDVGVHVWGQKWAKVWMRKLRRKKNGPIIEDPEPRIKIITLAEQLQIAQTEEMCLEDCHVESVNSCST